MAKLRVHALEAEQRRKLGRVTRERLGVRGRGFGELGFSLEHLGARVRVGALRARVWRERARERERESERDGDEARDWSRASRAREARSATAPH